MDQNIRNFIFTTFREAFEFINPFLSNYQKFSRALSKQVKNKGNNSIQYGFDIALDNIIKNQINKYGISGKIFSEESGFFEGGDEKYRIVYDPFCNSSLASKTFLDAAVGISVFGYDYKLVTSAIMDFQTGIVGLVENGKTNFYQIQTKERIGFDFLRNESLEKSWTAITLENREERKNMKSVSKIFEKSKRVIIGSGHIYWLRLATGAIDAYLDPFGGERLYEMLACTVAQKNGCIVTNLEGEIFDPAKYLKLFENNPNYIYYPIAATNKKLHNEILRIMKT